MSKWATQTLGDGDGEELAEAIREADRLIQIARDEEYARREAHPKTKPDPATEIHRSVIGAAETLWISKPIAGRRMISGIASRSEVNSHGYVLLARGCQLR